MMLGRLVASFPSGGENLGAIFNFAFLCHQVSLPLLLLLFSPFGPPFLYQRNHRKVWTTCLAEKSSWKDSFTTPWQPCSIPITSTVMKCPLIWTSHIWMPLFIPTAPPVENDMKIAPPCVPSAVAPPRYAPYPQQWILHSSALGSMTWRNHSQLRRRSVWFLNFRVRYPHFIDHLPHLLRSQMKLTYQWRNFTLLPCSEAFLTNIRFQLAMN